MNEPLVKNAADESQVKAATVKEKLGRDRELNDWRAILATPEGRRVIWRVLERAMLFKTIWEPSARIHFNAGLQDMGLFVLAEIMAADPSIFITMMTENKREAEEPKMEKEK